MTPDAFQQFERALTGRRWTQAEAAALILLIRQGEAAIATPANTPRAMSVFSDDPDFRPDLVSAGLRVFLNGVEQTKVVRYDMDAGAPETGFGLVQRLQTNDDGSLVLIEGCPVIESLKGVVSIEPWLRSDGGERGS